MVLEVRLRGMSGLDLQKWLIEVGIHTPMIFLTAHGDIPMAVRAMKAGAVNFLNESISGSRSAGFSAGGT